MTSEVVLRDPENDPEVFRAARRPPTPARASTRFSRDSCHDSPARKSNG